ncbi:MAG: hypothetical protein RMI91_11190 [Gemmatales bacterium]|nr:hypothetical protein [Gemmatales bacterium]
MTQELLFTSAERGLDLGRSGFCTVKRTRGMSKRLERLLHELSVYRALYPPHDARFAENPIVFMHCRASVDGQMVSILSRVCAAPPDYSGRSNYFAHHVVLSASELPQAGPAWLLKQQNFFESRWDGQVAELPTGRVVPRGEQEPRRCTTWELVTGDAGWAGVALRYLTENPTMPFYIIVEEKTPVLELLDELVALLPPDKRWSATFTTRYLHLPSGVTCAARFVPLGNEKISEAKASSRYLDLTALRGKHPPDDPYSEAARTGQHVQIPQQFLRAEDEPVLPVNLQAFSQVQVAGPIRHNPGLSVPQVPVTPAPPPPPTSAPSRRGIGWTILTVFHFLLTMALALALGITYYQMTRRYESLHNELSKNKPEGNDAKADMQSLRKELEKQITDVQNSNSQIQKQIDEIKKSLKDMNKHLAPSIAKELGPLKKELDNLRRTIDDASKFVEKATKIAMDKSAEVVASKVADVLKKLGVTEQFVEDTKTKIQEQLKQDLGRAFREAKPRFIKKESEKPPMVLAEGVRAVMIFAPNASVDKKLETLSLDLKRTSTHTIDNENELRLSLIPPSKNDKEPKLELSWKQGASVEQVNKCLNQMLLIIFTNKEIRVIRFSNPPNIPGS